MKKRLLSLALSIFILVCIVPVEAFASTTVTYANIVVFIDFSDTTHNHEGKYGTCYANGTDETLQYFNGSEDDQRGLKTYYEKISYGQISINNIMPQLSGSTITALKLKNNTAYYNVNANGADGNTIMPEVITYLQSLDLSKIDLDGNNDGCIDNITLVVPFEYGGTNTSNTRSYKTSWAGTDTLKGSDGKGLVRNYNVVSENNLYFGTQTSGVLIHEFGHTLGAPDLYVENSSLNPVGTWDIMSSVSYRVQYPLAYTRSHYFGLFDIPKVTTNKSCTLYSATSSTYATRNNQAIILETDYSEDEFFVVEYRKQGDNSAYLSKDYERTLYGSGLVIYRVNKNATSNFSGQPYHIYVFREDNDITKSYFSSESGRTSFKSLVYSDGTDSGITIKNIGSAAGDTITFDVEYSGVQSDYWKTEGSKDSESDYQSDIYYYADDENNQYFVSTSVLKFSNSNINNKLTLYSYKDGNWNVISSLTLSSKYIEKPKMVKVGSNFYVSVLTDIVGDSSPYLTLYKYDTGTSKWTKLYSTDYSYEYELTTDGSNVYLARVSDAEQYGGTYRTLLKVTSYNISAGTVTQLGSVNTTGYVIRPKLLTYAGNLYAAFLDSQANTGVVYVKKYDKGSNSWVTVKDLDANATGFSMDADNGYLYIFKTDSNTGTSTYDNALYKYDITNGGSWTKVGNSIANIPVTESAITFKDGIPFVVYQDATYTSQNIFVKQYKDNNWEDVGAPVASKFLMYLTINIVDDKVLVPMYIYDSGTDSYGTLVKYKYIKTNEEESSNRYFGSNRYKTSFATADALKAALEVDSFDNIIVADGTGFADALAGSYLASKLKAPILMANAKNGDDDTKGVKNYIAQNFNGNGKIYILGGTSAVSEAFEKSLKSTYGAEKIERIAGATRYETNIKILEKAGTKDQDILICNATGFADALSASALGKPILLVNNKSVGLTDAQQTLIKNAKNVYIIGGTSAVPKAYETQITNLGKSFDRIAGSNRYATSLAIADKFSSSFDDKTAVIATGVDFPDGLCGGPLAFALGAPLLLTNEASCLDTHEYVKSHGNLLMILGGTNAVKNSTINAIRSSTIINHEYK